MEHTIAQNKAPCFGGRAPLFSQRDLLRLVGPLLVEQLLAVTVGMADTMMVSRCGEAAISGVSLVDMINNLIIVLFAALATGGAVVVSQYLGAKEQKHANASSGQLILLSALLGVGVGVFCFVLARPMIRLCYGSIDADVLEAGVLYLRITAVSYPFLAMYNAGAALFRSMGNSKISMQISILMNIINIVGNAVCIFVLGMGVDGVAWPSVLSRAVAAVLILNRCYQKGHMLTVPKTIRLDGRMAKRILGIGIPSAFENSLFQAGRILVVSMISTFGTVQIAANAVANNLDGMGCIPGQAIGLAMITVVGRCVGAGDNEQTVFYTRKLLLWAYISMGDLQRRHPALPQAAGGHLRPLRRDHGAGHPAGADPRRQRPVPVAGLLCSAQRPARGQRCKIYHGGLCAQHGHLAAGIQLPALCQDGLGRCGCLDRHGH